MTDKILPLGHEFQSDGMRCEVWAVGLGYSCGKLEAEHIAGAPAYRVGRHQAQNVYRGEQYIGVMFSADDAANAVAALNGRDAERGEPDYLIDCDLEAWKRIGPNTYECGALAPHSREQLEASQWVPVVAVWK